MGWTIVQAALDHVPLGVWLAIVFVTAGVVYFYAAPIINVIWAVTPNWLKIVLGVVGTGIGIYIYGRTQGAKTARELEKQRQVNAVRDREKIHEDVKNLSDTDLDKRFDKWVR